MKYSSAAMAVILAIVMAPGCATQTAASGDVSIMLLGMDKVEMNSRHMTARQVADRLRSQKLARDAMIKVERGAAVSDEAMAHLVQTLHTAGYTRIVFVRKRQIEVYTPNDGRHSD